MKHLYLGTIAAGALALVLAAPGGAAAGGAFGAKAAVYTEHGDTAGFGVVEVGRYERHRGDRHRGRHGHYRRDHRNHGHHRRAYKYTRGYAHYGYPYYDHRARYSRPYGYGFGYRGGRDCW